MNKYLLLKDRLSQQEELKHSEQMELEELEKQAKVLSNKESRCIIWRLKLFAHVMLNKKGNSGYPYKALVDLIHGIIADNEPFLLGTNQIQRDALAYP